MTPLYALLFLSGLAGLGYEVLWTRMLSLGVGHEMPAVLAVVAAFFFGMAAGSWALDGVIGRSATPGRWYAVLEGIVGFWALMLLALLPAANHSLATLIGIDPSPLRQWGLTFTAAFAVLLPATFAMGGTLPAVERLAARLRAGGRSVGGFYAANTFGAVAGVAVSTFVLVPRLGYAATSLSFVGVNFLAAAGMWWVLRGPAQPEPQSPRAQPGSAVDGRLLGTLFFTGLLGIGYEVLSIRLMSQVVENTVYSFAAVLSVYLLGTAAGAALYQLSVSRGRLRVDAALLLQATAAACLIGVAVLYGAEQLHHALRETLGNGLFPAVLAEATLALVVLILPTMAMGALFSHLAQQAVGPEGGLGRALGANTLGASVAPALFGVVLLPQLGSKLSLVIASCAYLLLAPRPAGWQGWGRMALPAGLAFALLGFASPLQLVTLAPDERVLDHVEGVMATVTVVEDAGGDRHLKINNHFQMGGTSSRYSDRRQAAIPLLLHPDPRRALFLGLGAGGTLAAAAVHQQLEADGVELVPEVIAVLPYFEQANGAGLRSDRLRVHVADARRYVRAVRAPYDVIVADLFHPARDGAGSLYTSEHFRAIRERLAPGGLFCQWLPLYQLDLPTLRTIARTFRDAFPDARAFLAHYSLRAPIIGLVGGRNDVRYPEDWLQQRARDPVLARELNELRLDTVFELLGGFLGDAPALARFAGTGPLNTDDRPLVIFEAPRFAYDDREPAEDRLLAIIDAFDTPSGQVLAVDDPGDDREAARRMRAYVEARNLFLRYGAGTEPSGDLRRLVERLRAPLLAVVRTSPDFSAAYNPLLAMAYRLGRIDARAASSLLRDLEAANPTRHDARDLRRRLSVD